LVSRKIPDVTDLGFAGLEELRALALEALLQWAKTGIGTLHVCWQNMAAGTSIHRPLSSHSFYKAWAGLGQDRVSKKSIMEVGK